MATATLVGFTTDYPNEKASIEWANGQIWEFKATDYASASDALLTMLLDDLSGSLFVLQALSAAIIPISAPTQPEAGAVIAAVQANPLTNAALIAMLKTHFGIP